MASGVTRLRRAWAHDSNGLVDVTDMYVVYAIKSTVAKYIYVGLTDNLERRFKAA